MRLTLITTALALSTAHIQNEIRAGHVRSHGVNLGGWLLAENWMTDSSVIWHGLDNSVKGQGEFTTMKNLGSYEGNDRFQRHRNTFITEDDIVQIAAANINTVRVPVGYWIQGCGHLSGILWEHCETYAKDGLRYLDTLIRVWAKNHNIAVLVSIHGAPGSQNGADHSGAENHDIWWSKFPENVRATRDFAVFLATRYCKEEAFLGIGLLNEPVPPNSDQGFKDKNGVDFTILSQYYRDVYNDVRAVSDCVLVTAPLLYNQGPGSGMNMDDFEPWMKNVWHDWHPYVIWGFDKLTEDELIGDKGVGLRKKDIMAWKGKPLFLGEWSLVTPGASFSDPIKFGHFAAKYLSMLNHAKGGWTYWSWKKSGDEGGGEKWSLRSMLGLANSFKKNHGEMAIAIYGSDKKSLTTSKDPWRMVNDPSWIVQVGRAAEWWYNPSAKTLRSNRNGLCLDAYPSGGSFNVQGYACSPGNPNQKWKLDNHQIVHITHGQCLTNKLTMEKCDSKKSSQYFNIGKEKTSICGASKTSFDVVHGEIKLGEGKGASWVIDHEKLTVKDENSNKCLDAYEPQNGGHVHLFECRDGNLNQKWSYDAESKQLRHVTHEGFCLDIYGNGAGFHLYQCHGSSNYDLRNQQFDLEWDSYPELASNL